MYVPIYYILLKKKLVDLTMQCNNAEILNVLYTELKEVKLTPKNTIHFCSCGYPIAYEKLAHKSNQDLIFLEAILNAENDYDSYTISYYCPNCKKMLFENKY